MNFQQFRYVDEAVRRNLNLTEVAAALQTSQSGVSKQINDFEEELGIPLFVRRGKRFVGLTDSGAGVLHLIQRIAQNTEQLLGAADCYARQDQGTLVVATTHAQARYVLPRVIEQFRHLHPKVEIVLRQGAPRQVAEMLLNGEADLGIATEALAEEPDIRTLFSYAWHHVVAVHRNHALAAGPAPTIQDIATFPIITYDRDFSGRSHVDAAFSDAGLSPEIILTAIDADVIKAYVEINMGVGILAQMAVDAEQDPNLVIFDVPDMFLPNMTRIGVRKGAFLRTYAYSFLQLLVPDVPQAEIRRQLVDEG